MSGSAAVIAVGANSFLARATARFGPALGWCFITHEQAMHDPAVLDGTQLVVNFAFPPSFKTQGYDPAQDIDSFLARHIAGKPVHYIMLSSRMAYGDPGDDLCLSEDREPNPVNAYGKAKLSIERSLAKILPPERLTILRLSNIFGCELGRATFMGMAQTSLRREGRIFLDIDPQSVRDFLYVERFCHALKKIAAAPRPGLYNLGGGFPVTCESVLTALIEGYGTGEIIQTAGGRKGEFWLDMSKTRRTFGLPETTPQDLHRDIVACGRELKKTAVSYFRSTVRTT